jgi:hypothetical protein
MKTLVPPPPIASAHSVKSDEKSHKPQGLLESFDAAFLARTYRSMLVFGLVTTMLAAFALRSMAGTGSFVGGLLLAALLLRVQESSVRTALKPGKDASDMAAKLLVVMLMPLKLLAVGVVLWLVNAQGWLQVLPFTVGFFAAQLVILARIAGWLLFRAQARK